MAYEYGVNLKLDSDKALKDIDTLLAKLREMEKLAGQVKLKVSTTNDVEKQQREFMKQLQQMQAAEQKLATQRQLNEEKVQQAQNKTNAQQLLHEEKVAQAQNKTATQRATNEEKIRQEQQKTATEAERQAMDILKANEKVRQQKEKTRQEEQRTAQAKEQTARSEQRTNQESIRTEAQKVEFVNKLFSLYQRVTKEREREEDRANRIARAEQRATEQAEKRAAAVAKAVAARQKEEMISQATSGFYTASKRYAAVGRAGQIAGSVLNNVAQSMGLIQQAASQLTSNLWGYAQRIGSQIVSQVEKIAESALEQYKILETAEIGFGNFFNGSPAAFTQQVREHAEQMPGVGAQDLVRGIQYIAPLAGGNSQLALNAAEGVMKSILYSGNDVSAYGTNALQNLQQLASGNFTYADIRQMLRAMPTLPSLLAGNERGKELLDNGAITTEKMKAYIKKYGQSAILELFAELSENSAASDIYDKYRKTLSGAIEETGEHIKNAWNDAMENAGVYRTITQFLNKIVDSKVLDDVFKKLGDVVSRVINWFKNEKNADQIKAYFTTLKTVLTSFKTVLGQVAKDLGRSLGFLNANGTLNTAGLRQLTRQLAEFVKGLVKGFGGGLKTVIDLAKKFADSMGADGWRKLGEVIGTLASPLGKLITLMTKFGAAVSSIIGAFGTSASGMFKSMGNWTANKLESLLGTAAMTNAGFTTANSAAGNSVAGLLVSSAGKKSAAAAASAATRAQKIAGVAQWGSGVLRAGMFDMVIQSLGNLAAEFIKTSNAFGDNTPGIVTAIKTASSAIGTFALLFKVGGGGIPGMILGGVGALVAGISAYTQSITQQAREVQAKKDAEFKKQLEEAAPGLVADVAKDILEAYKNASGKEIDLNTEEGKAAYDNLLNYISSQIVETDENGNITGVKASKLEGKFQELFSFFTSDYKQQLMNSGLAGYTTSEGFYNAAQGGNKINLDESPALRDRAADLIRNALLNGTDYAEGGVYDYSQSNEKIVRDYLDTIGMDELTTGALEDLERQASILEDGIKPVTDDIKNKVLDFDNSTKEKFGEVTTEQQKLIEASETFNGTLKNIDNNVAQIAIATGGNVASMYGLTSDKISSWDSGYGFAEEFMPWRWDYKYSKLAMDTEDPMQTVTNNMSSAAEGYALKRVAGATQEEKDQADKDYQKVTKAMEELAKIETNDWGAFRKWLLKYKSYEWAGVKNDYFLASGGQVKPVYRASGGRGVDNVPAYLQPGEYVVRQRATSLAGTGVLDAINRGDLGAAARSLGARFSGSWNNSRSFSRTINNNQKTITNNVTVNNKTRAGGLNSYWSLANRMAASF